MGLEWASGDAVQPFCSKQNQWQKVAQDYTQWGSEHLHSFTGETIPVFNDPHIQKTRTNQKLLDTPPQFLKAAAAPKDNWATKAREMRSSQRQQSDFWNSLSSMKTESQFLASEVHKRESQQ